MKTSHIILLLIIAASLGLIVSMVGDFSTYQTFKSAFAENQKKNFKSLQRWTPLANQWNIIR